MKKEARLLKERAIDSLLLSIEQFNRPWDRGRLESVLMQLDHAFEMLLKAGLVHKGARIRERRAKQTLGFDACVRKALSDSSVRFLTDEQAITLQMINAQRDAAQHYLLEMSEEQLYMHAQAGVTLFADLLKKLFGLSLKDYLPERVMPVSTRPPQDLGTLIEDEIRTIRTLIKPGSRKRVEARSRARSLAIMEGAVQGERVQPGTGDLNKILQKVADKRPWTEIFPGVSGLRLTTDGGGIPFNLRITKGEGVPITLVPEGTPGASVVAVKRVDELGFYNIGHTQLAHKVGITEPKLRAVLWYLEIESDPEYVKVIKLGSQRWKRYSQKALKRLREEVPKLDLQEIWEAYTGKGVKKAG